MSKYNKNIAGIIIVICFICLITNIFIPKPKTKKQAKEDKGSYLPLTNKLSSKSIKKGERIAIIKLEGVISDSQPSSILRDQTTSKAVIELLHAAAKDDNVKAIVIRVNSPGGTVAASQELYNAVTKARKKKPIVITMGDVAASGGYYISCAGDVIFANPGTITGSIGVITSYLNIHGLLAKIGVEGVTIKAGKYKDIGNTTRPMTEEERKIFQALLDDSYNQFLEDVSEGRDMPLDLLKEIAQGLIYTGRQAKDVGLVDKLGDYHKAINHAQKLAKQRFPELEKKYKDKDLPLEETWKSSSVLDILIGIVNKNPIPSATQKMLPTFSYSKYQPLWLLE